MTRALPPPPTFSRSQSWASQARSDTTVEDSEPEREERRLKAKTVRRAQRKKPHVVAVASKQAEDVIELTDSSPSCPSTPAPRLLSTRPLPLVIIDVSDGDELPTHRDPPRRRSRGDDGHQDVVEGLGIEISGDGTLEDDTLPSIRRVLGLPKRKQKKVNVPGAVHSVLPGLAPVLTSTSTSSELSETESARSDGSKLKLGHFAYAAPNPLRRTVSKTPSPVERDPQTSEIMPDTKRTLIHRFADDFTDTQLSRLLKCVSCDLTWTARKTVKVKMKHIQSCAKKNRLTDETIRVLLRTEIDKSRPAPVASSSKSKLPTGPPTPSVPETLLEETLRDNQRKRSGPRLQVQPTVKGVSETRDDILDKARLLLQSGRNGAPARSAPRQPAEPSTGSVEYDPTFPLATQAFAGSSVAVRANDPTAVQPADTTQAFGSSRLSVARIQDGVINAGAAIAGESDVSPLTQVFTRSALAVTMADVDHSDDMPPATQVFAPSKLTNSGKGTHKVIPANGASPPPLSTHADSLRRGATRTTDDPISLYDTSEDNLELRKSSPARPPVIEIPSSPSSNVNLPRTLPTQTSPRAAATADPAAPDLRSPSPQAQRPSPTGDGLGSPAFYADGPDFHAQNEYEYLWNEWNHEQNVWDEYDGCGDAFLHYDPDANTGPRVPLAGESGRGPSKIPSPTSPPSPPRRRLAAIPDDRGSVARPSRIRDESVPPTEAVAAKKRKRGRPKKVATDESDAEPDPGLGKDVSQEELNAKLKEAVLKDEVLHLRILRYEPIHFDVFMQLAADAGVTGKKTKLKGKVRTFLDQKAIHFYGAEPTKSRIKRTRHT